MKKYLSIIAVAAMAAYATSALAADGTLGFNNLSTSLVQYTDPATSLLAKVPSGKVQLYYAAGGAALVPWNGSLTPTAWLTANAGWTLGPIANIAPAGRFNGNVATLTGITAGADASFAVIG